MFLFLRNLVPIEKDENTSNDSNIGLVKIDDQSQVSIGEESVLNVTVVPKVDVGVQAKNPTTIEKDVEVKEVKKVAESVASVSKPHQAKPMEKLEETFTSISLESFTKSRQAHSAMEDKPKPSRVEGTPKKRRFLFQDLKVRILPRGKIIHVTPVSADFGKKILVVYEECQEVLLNLENIGNIISHVVGASKHTSYEPVVGEVVLGNFEGDFYRAHCTGISQNGYHLNYIDYGNDETVDKFRIRPFDPKLNLERFLHTCYVENLPSDPTNKFNEICEQQNVMFETLKRDPKTEVYTVHMMGI